MNHQRNRRFLRTIALSVCSLSLLCSAPALAAESSNYNPTPLEYSVNSQQAETFRYVGLSRLITSLDIDSNGYASCTGEARALVGYTCDATLELQQKSGSTWETIKTWTSSGRINSFSKDWYVTSGHDYRLKLSADVYASSGSLVEKSITYSKTVDY